MENYSAEIEAADEMINSLKAIAKEFPKTFKLAVATTVIDSAKCIDVLCQRLEAYKSKNNFGIGFKASYMHANQLKQWHEMQPANKTT